MTPRPMRFERHAMTVLVLLVAGVAALATLAGAARPLGSSVKNPHGSFREPCEQCHTADGWRPARVSPKFDHGRFGFPLTGAHAAAACLGCHASVEFSKAEQRCAACHEDPHRGEMGAECARCHGARSFLDRTPMVRGHQLTAFPLSGSHAGLDCEHCHPPAAQGQLRFVGTPGECVACHLAAFRATTNPDHEAGGFPQDCRACHSTIGWNAANFDHAGTRFPLTGRHLGTPCASCHASGYAGTPTTCVSCHRDDYDATTSPAHAAAGFSTDCATCHNANGWDGANFNHDAAFFPIDSGKHAGKWNACSDCHTNASNYAVFTCLSCHPHSDKAKTDGDHRGRNGYSYTSTACYGCHPRGN